MHYRIFILAENIDDFDFDNIPTEYELFEHLSHYGIDYVSEEADLEDDIEWFKNILKIKTEKMIGGDKHGIYYKIDKQELIEALIKEKRHRLENVKKLIKDMEHDIMSVPAWKISNEIYAQKGFYFYLDGYGIMNEMDLLEDLKLIKNNTIYIVDSFDYHF